MKSFSCLARAVFFAVLLLFFAVASHANYQPQAPVRVILPAARDANAPSGLPLKLALDVPIREPNITRGTDGWYYLVGTTGPELPTPEVAVTDADGWMWLSSDGIRMWKSQDMMHWQSLGLVWSIQKDGTWAKAL